MKVFESELLLAMVLLFVNKVSLHKVIFSVNAGGDAFTDSNGIVYQKDNNTDGYTTTCPKETKVTGIDDADADLYRSIHFRNISYDIPTKLDNGEYLLNLKFIDCWSSEIKTITNVHVILNGNQKIASNLTLANGIGVAFDKYFYFTICDNQITYEDNYFTIDFGQMVIDIQAIKNIGRDPILSAILLIKLGDTPIPHNLWPTKDAELSKRPFPFVCRTTSDVYKDMQQHVQDFSTKLTNLSASVTRLQTQESHIGEMKKKYSAFEINLINGFAEIRKQQDDKFKSFKSDLIANSFAAARNQSNAIQKIDQQIIQMSTNNTELESRFTNAIADMKQQQEQLFANVSSTHNAQGVEIGRIQQELKELSTKFESIFDILTGITNILNGEQPKVKSQKSIMADPDLQFFEEQH
jgi:hypothetical protein